MSTVEPYILALYGVNYSPVPPTNDAILVAPDDPLGNFQDIYGFSWYVPSTYTNNNTGGTTTGTPSSAGSYDIHLTYQVVGNELTAVATIKNNKSTTKEFRVYLYGSAGQLINKEPDLSWKNCSPGSQITLQAGTAWHLTTVNDVYPGGTVRVYEQHEGMVAEAAINLTTGQIQNTGNTDTGTPTDYANQSQAGTGTTTTGTGQIVQISSSNWWDNLTGGIGSTGLIVGAAFLGYMILKKK